MTLVEVAARLNNARIRAVVAAFREPLVSLRRIVLLGLLLVVDSYAANSPAVEGLHGEARATQPWLVGMLVFSCAWAIAVRMVPQLRGSIRADIAGSIANFVGVGVLLRAGWDVMLPLVAVLPLASITAGALHGKRAFYASIAFSTLVVATSAPEGYWATRPFVGMLALALLIGLPLTVLRVLNGLREVSVQALLARDAQSRFLATMSHELRTPLNSVIGAVELLPLEEDPAQTRSLIALLSTNARALLHRVNEVLDVHAIDAGRLGLLIEPFTLGSLFHLVAAVTEPQANAKEITLRFSVDEQLGGVVLRSDPARVEQVLTNLVTNAIKFTGDGGTVCVSARSVLDKTRGKLVEFKVRDNGIGMSPDDQARIFDAFHQISSGASRRQDGVGLGLHIVKQLSVLMDGSITVQSAPGEGAEFSWLVPFELAGDGDKVSAALDFKAAIAEHKLNVAPMRCLAIDDNRSNLQIIARLLRAGGHSMVPASSADAGLELADKHRFDLIFLDIHMPGKSGWDFLEEFSRRGVKSKSVSTPIVMISADADPVAIERSRALGAVGYLVKPIVAAKVFNLLADVAAGRHVRGDTRGDSHLDSPGLEYLLNDEGDPDALREFTQRCVDGMDAHIEELDAALRSSNRPMVLLHIHSLQNEFLNLGFRSGVDECTRLKGLVDQGSEGLILDRLRQQIALAKVHVSTLVRDSRSTSGS